MNNDLVITGPANVTPNFTTFLILPDKILIL